MADAIPTPADRVEQADLAATSQTARGSRTDISHPRWAAALEMGRACGAVPRNPVDAVEVWRGLVSGFWSLSHHFDIDGRRYLVVRRNDPSTLGRCALTERERQVVAYVDLGHSNKLIAYQLGLSTSTVGVLLGRARTKLRLVSGDGSKERRGGGT